MSITLANEDKVLADVEREIDMMNAKIHRALRYAGEAGVNVARDPHRATTFTDRTGNLRSSIGSVVIGQNSPQFSGFKPINEGGEGADEGKVYAREIAATESISTVSQRLCVVAGKEYASYVAANGYDVLDAAEIVSRKTFNELMQK